MKFTVRDVQKLWEGRFATLVAGESGLDREVEFYDGMEQPDIKPWLRQNVLMITTGYSIRNDKEAVLRLIEWMDEANAAALAIKTRFFDEFPQEALELADKLNLPLFFLNNDAGFAEVVNPIMVGLVEAHNNVALSTRYQMTETNQKELNTKLFMEIIHGKIAQEEEAEYKANALHWPTNSMRLIVFQITRDIQKIFFESEIMDKIYSNVKIYMECKNLWPIVIIRKNECICIIKDMLSKEQVEELCAEMQRRIASRFKYNSVTGISESFAGYLQIETAYRNAQDAVRICRNTRRSGQIAWIEEEQFEQIMLRLSRDEFSRNYVKDTLVSLKSYDQEHDSHLEETLEAYLRNRGSRKLAAEELFLHRNTMAYRLKQIEQLLDCDLSSNDHQLRLNFAFKVKEYMEEP